jgi:hypothetical protein
MMNLNQAIAYGNQMGVKFYVRNSNGGLMGGTKTREQAQAMKKEFEERYKNDAFNKDLKLYIEEV